MSTSSKYYENWEDEHVIQHLLSDWNSEDKTSRNDLYNVIKKYFKNGMKLLDAGCGVGFDYPGISKIVGDGYTGVDISKKMIEFAKKNNPDGNFVRGDIFNLDFDDNTFDIVVCADVLRHVPDYVSALKELIRVSKSIIIINVLLTPNDELKMDTVRFIDRAYNNDDFFNSIINLGYLINDIKWTNSDVADANKAIIQVMK